MIKFLEHTADVKFQASGKTLEEAFANCVAALKKVMTSEIRVHEKEKKIIKVSGKNPESLLQQFLEEFLYLLDAENFLISKVEKIKISGNKLEAVVFGDNAKNYKFSNPVKAVTYNQMFVKQKGKNFICQVVLDV